MAKVLLVEDDNNLREIYEARLSAEAYDIITAQNGEEALVVAKKEHPDLIISDVMMPRISGFEMLDILRNTDELRDTKVIMLTALGQAEDQSRAGKLGADKYLVKSQVTLEDIVNTANELLGIIPAASPATTPDPSPASIPAPVATPVAVSGLDLVSTPPIAQPVLSPQQVTTPIAQSTIPDPISAAPQPVAAPTVVEPVSAEPAPETPAPAVVQDSIPQANQGQVNVDPVAIPEPTPIPEPVVAAIPVPNQVEVSANIVQPPDTGVPMDTPEDGQPPIVTVADPDPISAAPQPVAAPTVVEPVSAEPAPETPAPAVVQDSIPQANQGQVNVDPVAIPEPTPIPEPVVAAIPVPNQVDFEEAQTTAAEEATVESQIENFAANTPMQEADQAETANDQTLAEAVNDLTAATNAGPEPVLPPSQKQIPGEEVQADSSAPVTFVAPPIEPVEQTAAPAPTEPVTTETPGTETQAVAGHKVIQPINSTAGPNLEELLAKEAAKEEQNNPQVATPIINGAPVATPTAPATGPANPGFDPSSIAL